LRGWEVDGDLEASCRLWVGGERGGVCVGDGGDDGQVEVHADAMTLGLRTVVQATFRAVVDPHLHRLLEQTAPMNAGSAIQVTTDQRHLPIGPWAGLGVLAAWSAGTLLAGTLLLRFRDT
jgi:hypothetical protein